MSAGSLLLLSESTPLLLDSGPLGKIAHPRRRPEIAAWFDRLTASERSVYLLEIADYETRRNFLLEYLTKALERLDALRTTLIYLPLDTAVMVKAAELWAQTRKIGNPTADPKELDGDVILAAQALAVGGIVITDNSGHLGRFVTVRTWSEIEP